MERSDNTFNPQPTPEERFDRAKTYWSKAVGDGRLQKTNFFKAVFESEDTELYRENADDEMLFLIAKSLNECWIGVTSEARLDLQSYLPAAAPASASSAPGEAAPTEPRA